MFIYNMFSKVTNCKSCSRKMHYVCVWLHFPWHSGSEEGTYAPGDRGGSLEAARCGP